jgi:hypothetical protein
MKLRHALAAFAMVVATAVAHASEVKATKRTSESGARAASIATARYATPVERYGHFALGRPHEYARLTATTSSGRSVELALPDDEVFEDLVPRLVQLAAHAPTEILAIVSRRGEGARLVLVGLNGDRLEISATSPPIGRSMRWLNPVGVVDLDGDGQAEIAMVATPHIGGTLKIFRRSAKQLVEIAALSGFSNHVYGSPELGLSVPASIAGQMHLLVPDTTRRALRITALVNQQLVEVGHCALPAAVTGPTKLISPTEVSVSLSTGRQTLVLVDCLASGTSAR